MGEAKSHATHAARVHYLSISLHRKKAETNSKKKVTIWGKYDVGKPVYTVISELEGWEASSLGVSIMWSLR